MRVLVVYGGGSAERDVSLAAGKSVGAALVAAGHTVTYFDPGDDTSFMLLRNLVLDKDVVFPVLYGRAGEDGGVQVVLESLDVPFVGSPSAACKNSYDKASMLTLLHNAGILVPTADLIAERQLKKHPLAKAPFVLAPRYEGSHSDTYLVHDPKNYKNTETASLFARHGSLLIEALISGSEVTVAVMGGQASPVVEVVSAAPSSISANAFYRAERRLLCPPQTVPADLQRNMQEIALKAHMVLGCRHMSSTDMVVDKEGQIYCLEVNSVPDMTTEGALAVAAAANGITEATMVDYLVKLAASPK